MNGWLARQLINTNRLNMWSMLYLRGSGGIPPQKCFCKFSLFSIEFDNISGNIFD